MSPTSTDDRLNALGASGVRFRFGDNEELSVELLSLVRSGKKTATCEALRTFGAGGDAMPVVGRRDLALNWDGTPALLLETTEVFETRFCDVDEDFALAEGENENLAGWRRDHRQYFERTCGFDEKLVVICERFELIYDFEADQT